MQVTISSIEHILEPINIENSVEDSDQIHFGLRGLDQFYVKKINQNHEKFTYKSTKS